MTDNEVAVFTEVYKDVHAHIFRAYFAMHRVIHQNLHVLTKDDLDSFKRNTEELGAMCELCLDKIYEREKNI